MVIRSNDKPSSFTNSIGEEFFDGDTGYYYSLDFGELELIAIESLAVRNAAMTDSETAIAKTPAGALIELNEYYKRYGYPKERSVNKGTE